MAISSSLNKEEQAHHNLREMAADATRKAQNAYSSACEEVSHVKESIRHKPVEASLIALVVGYMIGAFFRR